MSVKIISIKTLPKKSQVVTIKKHTKKAPPAPSKDTIISVIQPSKSKELTSPTSQPSQSEKLDLPTSHLHDSMILSPLNHPPKSNDAVPSTSQSFQSEALSPLKSYPQKSMDDVPPTSEPFQSETLSPLKSYPSRSRDRVPPTIQPFQSKALSPVRSLRLKSKELALAASKPPQPKTQPLGLPTFHIVPKERKPFKRISNTKPRIISKIKPTKSSQRIDDTVAESPSKKIPKKVLSESFAEPKDSTKKTPEKLISKIDSNIEPDKTVKLVMEKLPATASSAILKIPVQMKKDKAPVITVAKSKALIPAVTKDMPIITNVDEPTNSGQIPIQDIPIISDINQSYNPVPMTLDNMSVITSGGELGKPIQVIFQQLPQQTASRFKPKGAMQVVLESVPKNPVTSVEPKSSMQVILEQAPQASTSVGSNVTKIIQKLPIISNITSLANVNIMEFLPTSEASTAVIEPMEFNFDESLFLSHSAETVQHNPDVATTIKHDSHNRKADFKCPYCEYYSRKTSFVYTHIRKKHEGMRVYYINA